MQGRPKIQIDFNELDKLLEIQCTLKECANHFDVSEDTIERRILESKQMTFADYFKLKRSRGFISLRRKQYELAMSGDIRMLIWLGKNWLDQTDKRFSEIQTKEPVTIDSVLRALDKVDSKI